MLEWLEDAQRRLDASVDHGLEVALSPADIEALLELARAAAQGSGDRTNAPLVAYLVGVAHGRNPTVSLSELVAAVIADRG